MQSVGWWVKNVDASLLRSCSQNAKAPHEEQSRASLEEAFIDDALLEDRLHAAREHGELHSQNANTDQHRINTAISASRGLILCNETGISLRPRTSCGKAR
jgi:hypothetical protein